MACTAYKKNLYNDMANTYRTSTYWRVKKKNRGKALISFIYLEESRQHHTHYTHAYKSKKLGQESNHQSNWHTY